MTVQSRIRTMTAAPAGEPERLLLGRLVDDLNLEDVLSGDESPLSRNGRSPARVRARASASSTTRASPALDRGGPRGPSSTALTSTPELLHHSRLQRIGRGLHPHGTTGQIEPNEPTGFRAGRRFFPCIPRQRPPRHPLMVVSVSRSPPLLAAGDIITGTEQASVIWRKVAGSPS